LPPGFQFENGVERAGAAGARWFESVNDSVDGTSSVADPDHGRQLLQLLATGLQCLAAIAANKSVSLRVYLNLSLYVKLSR